MPGYLRGKPSVNVGTFIETGTDYKTNFGGLRGDIQSRGYIMGEDEQEPQGGWVKSQGMSDYSANEPTPRDIFSGGNPSV